ncbi:MAG: hypothetical protein R3Y43_06560 [Alphaproteobacteria bacterium]
MKKFLFLTLFISFTSNLQAQDIVVNNNVLEALKATEGAPAPLFPVLPKTIKENKAPIIKKTVAKKAAPVKKTEAPKTTPKKTEAKPQEQADLQKEFDNMKPIVTEAKKVKTPVAKSLKLEDPTKEKPVAHIPEEKQAPVVSAPIKKEAPNNKISFDSFEATLSPENKKQIDAIISSFKDAKNNRISITAYNLEGEENAFKKKRQVLNHALDVRTYLIKKGYSNCSIRVLSVTNDPQKRNVVEISETE